MTVDDRGRRVLYVVVCAAPAAADVHVLAGLARAAGWTVRVVASPLGLRFIDAAAVERATGDAVRSEFRMPDAAKALPLADAVVVAPATFNTINKWAAGIADTFAVSLLCELTGTGIPILAVPLVKAVLASHPAFDRSLDVLRGAGVRVLFDPDAPPHARMPSWEEILEKLGKPAGQTGE